MYRGESGRESKVCNQSPPPLRRAPPLYTHSRHGFGTSIAIPKKQLEGELKRRGERRVGLKVLLLLLPFCCTATKKSFFVSVLLPFPALHFLFRCSPTPKFANFSQKHTLNPLEIPVLFGGKRDFSSYFYLSSPNDSQART